MCDSGSLRKVATRMKLWDYLNSTTIGGALLAIVSIGAILAWTWLLVARPWRRSRASWCGQCGYDVRAATTLRCTECGSDLRIVGIRARRRRISVLTAMFIATAAAFVVAVGLYSLVVRFVPAERVTFRYTHGWSCGYSHPREKPYAGFTLTARTENSGAIWAMSYGTKPRVGKPQVVEIDVKLQVNGRNADTVTVRGPSLEVLREGVPQRSIFDAAFVRAWLSERGAGSERPEAESVAIASTVAGVFQQDLQPSRVGAFAGFGWLTQVPFQSAYQRVTTYREWYAPILCSFALFLSYLFISRDATRDQRTLAEPAVVASA